MRSGLLSKAPDHVAVARSLITCVLCVSQVPFTPSELAVFLPKESHLCPMVEANRGEACPSKLDSCCIQTLG